MTKEQIEAIKRVKQEFLRCLDLGIDENKVMEEVFEASLQRRLEQPLIIDCGTS